jgi:hypothetical protein
MKEIKLTLTLEEANEILDALGSRPFNRVYALIGKIQAQAAGQLADIAPEHEPENQDS